jgi:multimeric flavodoxin WrbA
MRKADKARLLLFQGSARRNGNTDILCREAVKGAVAGGMATRLVRLADLRIEPCRGCFRCQKGSCRTRDDMGAVIEEMAAADALVFATPVYFWNVSGLMKMFFDRLLPLLRMRKVGGKWRLASRLAGKRAGIIVVQEEAEGPHESIPLLFFRRNFSDFDLEFSGSVFAFGALNPGDVRRQPAVMEEARALGRRLAALPPGGVSRPSPR